MPESEYKTWNASILYYSLKFPEAHRTQIPQVSTQSTCLFCPITMLVQPGPCVTFRLRCWSRLVTLRHCRYVFDQGQVSQSFDAGRCQDSHALRQFRFTPSLCRVQMARHRGACIQHRWVMEGCAHGVELAAVSLQLCEASSILACSLLIHLGLPSCVLEFADSRKHVALQRSFHQTVPGLGFRV